MMRWTTPCPSAAACTRCRILCSPFLAACSIMHDDALDAGDEVHRAAHALDHLARDHPVREVARPRRPASRRGSRGRCGRRGSSRRSRRSRRSVAPGSTVTVCLPALIRSASTSSSVGNGPMPSRPFSDCSITSMPGRDVVGDERRHADAEVDVEAVAQLLRGAAADLFAVQWHCSCSCFAARCAARCASRGVGHGRSRCTKMPGVWTLSGSSSPSSTSSSTSAMLTLPAVAAHRIEVARGLAVDEVAERGRPSRPATIAKSPTMRALEHVRAAVELARLLALGDDACRRRSA